MFKMKTIQRSLAAAALLAALPMAAMAQGKDCLLYTSDAADD